jgi:hypothetical protein
MNYKLQKITFSIFTSLVLTNGSINAQCTVPSLGSASPAQRCAPGGTTNLNATSVGNSIAWYTVPVGGTSLGSAASGSNFNVNAVATTTYYAEAFSVVSNSTTLNFTGAVQTFSAPVTGNYTLQAWGAKGGNDGLTGANGGYATGVLALTAGQTISIYVGGIGGNCTYPGGGWNGGGNAGPYGCSGGGGGASDVRFGGTALANRVIVAGGGGGAGNGINAGAGGGLLGINGEGSGGTQSAGGAGSGAGSLGQGGNHNGDGGGGGGGYYGGGSAYNDNGGGGGSSYIGGVLIGSTIAGNASMPNPAGGTMIGNSIDGKVIIRYPSVGCVSASRTAVVFTVNPLPTITVTGGSICNGSSFTMVPAGASTYTYSSGSAVVAPTTNTSYTVTGTSAAGCVSAIGAVALVAVNANPIITVSSGSICNGSSYTMIPGGASTYTYSSGTSVVAPTTNTSYTVTGTSAAGCVGLSGAVSSVVVNAIPVVTVNSGSICNGSSFTMVPAGASTYTYSSGTAVVAPTTNTSYTVTGTSAAGCASSSGAVSSVVVNAIPVVTVNSGAICSGASFTMVPAGASTYVYSGGSAIVSPAVNTSYTVTGTNAAGCTNTAASTVTVNALPILTATSGSICSGNSFTMVPTGAITYTYSGGSSIVSPSVTTSYTVSGSNAAGCVSSIVKTITVSATPVIVASSGAVCIGGSWTITPTGATTYTYSSGSAVVSPTTTTSYTVSGSSATGCQSSAVLTVSVNPTLLFNPNSGSVCIGSTFTMTPSGALSYTYSSGTSAVTPTTTTTYTIVGVNSVGCYGTQICTVTVNALPTLTVNGGAICSGQSFTIVPTGAITYTYSSGSDVVSPIATTDYSVTGTDVNGCVTAVNAISSVTVNANPTVIATSDFTLICTGEVVTLNASGATSYTWNTGATTTSVTDSPTITTTYTVNASDVNGCNGSSNVTVNVNDCVGLQNLSLTTLNVSLYPNPTTGNVTLELNTLTNVLITNALGQIVLTETLPAGKQILDIKNQTNGLYFVKLNQNGKQQIIKLIKD